MSRLIQLRDGWGWALGLVALGLAFFGEKLAEDARIAQNGQGVPPLLSWVLFGAAAILFVLGIAPAPRLLNAPPLLFLKSLRARRKSTRLLFVLLIVLALLCSAASIPLFISLNAILDTEPAPGWLINTGPWVLYVASLLFFVAALVVWERGNPATLGDTESAKPVPGGLLPRRIEWLIIVGFFILALLLRVPNLENAPPGLWFDEAYHGGVAQTLLAPNSLHRVFIEDIVHFGSFYFYLLGAVLKIFGTTVGELRILPALAGSIIVPMIYLLGARLYGWRVGLAAAGLLVVSSWNLTFSRFGMVGMFTAALDVGVFLCVVQALRTGKLRYYAGAGVLLGFAVQTYYTARLVPFILLAVLLHRLITDRMRLVRTIRVGLAVFVLGAALASAPIDIFALQKPDVFNNRISTATIFSQEGSGGDPNALVHSFDKHMLMFNFQGDSNGRHNLPGRPMLDWLTAALFFAGLGTAILRSWRWQYFFPVAWFAAVLSGGVLSLIFEAPQSHRTLENSVVAPLIAAIFLGELWGALDGRVVTAWSAWQARRKLRMSRKTTALPAPNPAVPPGSVLPAQAAPPRFARYTTRAGQSAIALAVLLLLTWVGFANIDRYFNKQMNDGSVWMEMGGVDKAVGELMASSSPGYRLLVDPKYLNVPATAYLAPGKQAEVWQGSYVLPFIEERDVVVMIDPSEEGDVSDIVRIYPHAQVTVVHATSSDQPQLFALHITTDDIKSVRGSQRIDDSHAAATLKVAQYGMYGFGWQSTAGSIGTPEVWVDGTQATLGEAMPLGAGLHSVVISGTQGTGIKADFSNLLWSQNSPVMSPVPSIFLFNPTKIEPHGLTAFIRAGDSFDTAPAQVRIDPQVSFYFQLTPLPRPYTIEWVGKLYTPVQGGYVFSTEQISKSRLVIDGKDVVTNSAPNNVVQGGVTLQQGLHDIQLFYEDLAGFSHVYLYWQPPTMKDKYIIPSLFLLPEMGKYPETPASGAWPTIDEADDTVWARAAANPASHAAQPAPIPAPPDNTQPQPVAKPTSYPGKTIVPNLLIGGIGNASLPLPRAVAADADGNIFIYTESNSKITKYAPDGHKVADWTVAGTDGKPITEGAALLVKDGKLYFLDAASATLITYDLDGKAEGSVHICSCYFPRGLVFSNDGNLWAADTGLGHIFKVNLQGQTIATIGAKGSAPGQFVEPASVWESPQGILFVADVGNKRVQSFTPDGKPLAQWPIGEGASRDNNRLSGTPDGDVLVTEYTSRAIVEYDANGNEKHRWTYAPAGESLVPAGIAPYGNGKYMVLFPFDNSAIIFDITQR